MPRGFGEQPVRHLQALAENARDESAFAVYAEFVEYRFDVVSDAPSGVPSGVVAWIALWTSRIRVPGPDGTSVP
ncbi:MAG: hypothetical protein ACJ72I_17380 [Pseudonocardiaceae bacterium]